MASFSPGSSHLGVTDDQKRWLVAGIALNKILIPQIRPFVEQEVDKEYNNLKTSHNIHTQSTPGRLQRWPAPRGKFLKYENINGNDTHPKLSGGRYDYHRFDCRVLSHVDFARLYVENYMAKFNAFDDHCDASAVLLLVGGVPVFSAAVQAAAGDVRTARNDWAHCVFSKWDPIKFQHSFIEMEHLVREMALPAADEGKLLGKLKDWETKGIQLCMNSPVDPALLQLVQQNIRSLQDDVNNMSEEFDQEKVKVQQELQNVATILKEIKERVQRLEENEGEANMRLGKLESLQQNTESHTEQIEGRVDNVEYRMRNFQGDANRRFEELEGLQQITESHIGEVKGRVGNVENRMDGFQGVANQRFESLESRTGEVENQMHNLHEKFDNLTVESQECASCHDPPMAKPVGNPEKLVELIGRDYKRAVLCPFPWCEDELQMNLSNIFTRLQIKSRTKERSKLTDNTINMTDIFIPHAECVNPRVVLIEGNPGMGKTTYCQKLAYDWSVGEIPPKAWFPKVEMLLLLKCRDMHMKTASIQEVIDDQLLPQDADKKEKENFFHFIRSNQSRILLVLDGLDELRQDLIQDFLPLIQGKVFSNIYLLLTARHEAGMRIRRYCDTLLEIVGYTHDDADDYIERYFSNHEDKSLAGKMINQLNKDKQLRELTANPLNTALLCLLYDETRGVFPSKKNKLYDDLVSCGLRRYFAKNGVSLGDDDPVERCADQLNQLGKMAFEAFLKNQLYFSQDEMNCQSTDFVQLPFLSREPNVSKIRPKPCFAFTHKTLQEYFAAFYLAHQILTRDKGIETLLAQLSPVDSWQVWEFLLTMVSSKSSEMAVFVVSRICAFFYRERPRNTINAFADADDDLDDFELCKLKVHDWTVCMERWSVDEKTLDDVVTKTLHLIAECEDGENELRDYQKKMVHVLARCFPVKKLSLAPSARYRVLYSEYLKTNCTLTYLRLHSDLNELLLSTIENVFHPGHKLVFLKLMNVNIDHLLGSVLPPSQLDSTIADLRRRYSGIERFGAQAITTFLQSCHLLTHVSLSNVSVQYEGAIAVAQFIHTNRNLTHLSLCNAQINDTGAIEIAYVLHLNCTLTHLSLSRNWITGFGANALANGTLQYLDLSGNVDGESVAQALALVLESNRVLSYVDLGQSAKDPVRCITVLDSGAIKTINISTKLIGPSGALALARALRVNCTLTYFDVKCNNIRDSGAAAFGQALQANCILSHLDLSGNMIGDLGAACLGEALRSNSTLTLLYLMENKIGDPGAEALGKALQSNRSLTHLSVQVNHIGDSGTAAFAKALQSTGIQLTHLDMAVNEISSLGAVALAEALHSNSSLTGLELGHNKIESSGAAALAEALRSNCTLMHLMVSSNSVTDMGATELAKALQYNNRLIYLNLEHNPFGSLGEENLERVDQSKCVVKYFSSLGVD